MVCPLSLACLRRRPPAASVITPLLTSPAPSSPRRCTSPPPLPVLLHQTLAPFHNSFKVAHVNAQSLLCHIDEFKTIFQNSLFDLIAISETWLKPNISDKSVSLQEYCLFRNDRTHKGGGGIAIFVKSHHPTSILHLSDTSREGYPEFMFLDVSVNGTHILVSVCYRAPNLRHLQEYEIVLQELMARYSHVIVTGDLNTNLLGPVTYDQTYLTTMLHSCNMTILPLNATHHTSTADTWLDIITVSDPTLVSHHGQFPAPGLSKHDLIYLVYNLRSPKTKPKFISFRNYKTINLDALLTDVSTLPWDEVLSADGVDLMISKFNKFLTGLYDKHAPVVKKRVTKGPAPWLTVNIRRLQNHRDSAFRQAKKTKSVLHWENYKRLRNHTQQQIRNAKIRYYYSSLSRNQSTKTLWSKVKELGIGKQKHDTPIHLDLNTINDYFTNIPIDSSGAKDYVAELKAFPQHQVPPGGQFSFSSVTEDDVLGSIMRLTSNAVGADDIPIRFIKDTLPITLPIITAIFNKSLSSSIFPQIWKSAVVRPLPKCLAPGSPSDFRPVSILPALSKCLERIAHNQLYFFFDANNIVSSSQSGFRPHHSTTTALLKITDDIRLAMDKRQITILTLFDFSKAFDCVYHPLLLSKLKLSGLSDGCVDWVKSYLTDRRQLVRSGDSESNWRPVSRGVPQGSVLGPLFFSLYINNITDCISHSQYHLYADDLQIYHHFSAKDMANSVLLMNTDIKSITLWTHKHGLKLNESKTQTIIIGSTRLRSQINLETVPKLKLNNIDLEYSDKVKNLGLTINSSLKWNDAVTTTCNRVFASIHSLKRFALYLPYSVKVMLVKTLVLPIFNYCDIVTNDMTVELSDKLQRAQNYCIRFIFNLRRDEHITPYLQQLSLLKLEQLRKYHTLTLLHALLQKSSPTYLFENFIFLSQINSHVTRRGGLSLSIPPHKTIAFNKSFIVTACRLWNSLPDNIKLLDKRARFGAEVKSWLTRDCGTDG